VKFKIFKVDLTVGYKVDGKNMTAIEVMEKNLNEFREKHPDTKIVSASQSGSGVGITQTHYLIVIVEYQE
jgi:hypothetical protein